MRINSMGEDLSSTHNWVWSPIPPKTESQLILPQRLSDGLFDISTIKFILLMIPAMCPLLSAGVCTSCKEPQSSTLLNASSSQRDNWLWNDLQLPKTELVFQPPFYQRHKTTLWLSNTHRRISLSFPLLTPHNTYRGQNLHLPGMD